MTPAEKREARQTFILRISQEMLKNEHYDGYAFTLPSRDLSLKSLIEVTVHRGGAYSRISWDLREIWQRSVAAQRKLIRYRLSDGIWSLNELLQEYQNAQTPAKTPEATEPTDTDAYADRLH